jgi:hypothetical protein
LRQSNAPDASALESLRKIRARVTTTLTPAEHNEVETKLDEWERTFLKGAQP